MNSTKTRISKVNTVVIPVSDQDRMIEFYVEKLGFEKRSDVPFGDGYRWVEVGPGDGETTIALAPPPPGGDSGNAQTGIALQTSDIDADHAELKSSGVDVDAEVSRMGIRYRRCSGSGIRKATPCWSSRPTTERLANRRSGATSLYPGAGGPARSASPRICTMSYTIKNLREIEDMAPRFGFGSIQEARFPWRALNAEDTGLAYHVIKPGQRNRTHRHNQAEEIYVVLAGSGRVNLDGELVELKPLDAIRVAPPVKRAFEAGEDGLELLAFGPHHEGDGELLDEDPW